MKNSKAFTLVELIVVITILAILGTIAFISFQSYSQTSRDSVRISDLGKIKSSIELHSIDAGRYPSPNNAISIMYDGGIVWEQGSFGESTFTNTDSLNKIPKDPLANKEYTYSITSNGNQFQLGSVYEGDNELGFKNETYAGDKKTNAYVTGNYNGFAAKSINGNDCYVLNVPSIISSDIDTSNDYEEIVNTKKLVFNGYSNIPSTYKGSKFKIDGGFDYTPTNLVIYSDNNKCIDLETDEQLRINHLKSIQDSYIGTILENKDSYSNFIEIEIDEDILENNSDRTIGTSGSLWPVILGKKFKSSYTNNSGIPDGGEDPEEVPEGTVNLNVGDTIVCPLCGS